MLYVHNDPATGATRITGDTRGGNSPGLLAHDAAPGGEERRRAASSGSTAPDGWMGCS